MLAGCGGRQQQPLAAVTVEQRPFAQAALACSGRFVAHSLDHVTTTGGETVKMFDSNGAGLAVNDLDRDGDLDLVLANLQGNNAIFWNEGQWRFRKQALDHGHSRAVNSVDVDGDGWLDIVFTTRNGAPVWWHNHAGAFSYKVLPNVWWPAYAMTWGDVDGDGDLDLVTASYDAALEKDLGDSFMFGQGAGVFYYENQDGFFAPQRLAQKAQGLAVLLLDVDEDSRPDILVGNDFSVPDQVWLNREKAWTLAEPFAVTTHSTMSFDSGDIDNDGRWELLATDMKPYAGDPVTLAAWQPVMEMMPHHEIEGDPQVMENVLQVRQDNGRFDNGAPSHGLDATGWSWSGKFGDLDNDGFLDLYVVNGMTAIELFGHLPNGELVEENQAFRNNNGQAFVPAPAWKLNVIDSGRGMSMADLDNDGDLDIVVNNLLTPAQVFENRLCRGDSLEIDLFWPGSKNTRALGAQVILHTGKGRLTRDVRAGSGYLSGDPARLHFGFPSDSRLEQLEIIWPDGATSILAPVPANVLLRVERQ